jgi:hypothetical protein
MLQCVDFFGICNLELALDNANAKEVNPRQTHIGSLIEHKGRLEPVNFHLAEFSVEYNLETGHQMFNAKLAGSKLPLGWP